MLKTIKLHAIAGAALLALGTGSAAPAFAEDMVAFDPALFSELPKKRS